MKTDTIFYQLFQTFPRLLFELLRLPPESADYYQFSSVEVKQLSFRIDGVFLPRGSDLPLYFLEVQFQTDLAFYSRFFSEIFLYLRQSDVSNDWHGVVIYPSRRLETTEITHYRDLLNPERVTRIYLDELGDIFLNSIGLATLELVTVAESQVVEKARNLIAQVRGTGDENYQRELLKLIETLLIYKLPRANRKEIEAMFSLSDLKQTRFYQEALEEGIEQGIERGLEQGLEQGIERGLKQGLERGKLAAIPLLLQLGATPEQIADSLGIALAQVLEVIRSRGETE